MNDLKRLQRIQRILALMDDYVVLEDLPNEDKELLMTITCEDLLICRDALAKYPIKEDPVPTDPALDILILFNRLFEWSCMTNLASNDLIPYGVELLKRSRDVAIEIDIAELPTDDTAYFVTSVEDNEFVFVHLFSESMAVEWCKTAKLNIVLDSKITVH